VVEAHRITVITHSLGELVQQEHRGFIGDKDMKPPSAVWVRLYTVEELAVTVFEQFAAKALTVIMDRLTVCSPRLGRSPPVRVAGGSRNECLGRWKTDGPNVRQQAGREGRYVVFMRVFRR
jgi:hypothetical protein